MKSVKLYGYATSPYVRKTGCFLYYKRIDFSHIPVNPVDPAATIGYTGGTQVLDLAVFPQIIFGYMFGLEEHLNAARHPVMKGWLERVAADLPDNPTLAADEMQVNSLAEALA